MAIDLFRVSNGIEIENLANEFADVLVGSAAPGGDYTGNTQQQITAHLIGNKQLTLIMLTQQQAQLFHGVSQLKYVTILLLQFQ